MTTILMITAAAGFLLFSILKSRKKTIQGMKIAKKMMISTFIDDGRGGHLPYRGEGFRQEIYNSA